jgi:hypothetical protein
MPENLKINVISFLHKSKPIHCSFFNDKKEDFKSLSLSEAPIELANNISTEYNGAQRVYTNFKFNPEADIQAEINLVKSPRFAKHFYTNLIRNYFINIADLINNNFINDIEVWFLDDNTVNANYQNYIGYGLRVQITENLELLIYSIGNMRVLKESINELTEISNDDFLNVIYNKEVIKYKSLPEEAKYNLNLVFPILSKKLEQQLKIPSNTKLNKNKYISTWDTINYFYNTYINNSEFKQLITLKSEGFDTVNPNKIFYTRKESNKIQLGLNNKVSTFSPKTHLKEHGPYQLPDNTNVKFIVFFHKDDKDYANKLVSVFNKKYILPNGTTMDDKYGASLYDYIRIRFVLDKEHCFAFENIDNPLPELHNFLDNCKLDYQNNQYVALYISPYNKTELENSKRIIYYKIKELLLKHHITSQTIYREQIHKKEFKTYFYANIAVAILAKTGGIPWRLESPIKNELVVGVGAFKSKEVGIQFIGSAFCFSNNGEFKEFGCIAKSESFLLAQEIKVYIQDFVNKHQKLERLIIHFYKQMSRKEIEPIQKMLFNLGYPNLPIIIINVNKTYANDYMAFDTSFDKLIPHSGTIINYAKNKYLLFNNTRYFNGDDKQIESYHAPLKLSFQSTHPETLKDVVVIKELIDQIYQFSRMYWKSVKQQNLPVTVKYPKMVAKMYPYFESNDIPSFGKQNMWFL